MIRSSVPPHLVDVDVGGTGHGYGGDGRVGGVHMECDNLKYCCYETADRMRDNITPVGRSISVFSVTS